MVSRWSALALASWILSVSGTATANGRFPNTVAVKFRPGSERSIYLGTTFGLLISHDDGQSFRAVCEDVLCPSSGDGGPGGCGFAYDPDFEIAADGSIYLTTLDAGLHLSSDGGCSFQPVGGALAGHIVRDVEIGPDGSVWAVTDTPGATTTPGQSNGVYVRRAGSASFVRVLEQGDGWFHSIRVAPTPAQAGQLHVYVSGMLAPQTIPDGGSRPVQAFLYRSDNGGASFRLLPTEPFASPDVFVAAVSPADPDVVFVRAPRSGMDHLYRTANAAATTPAWQHVLALDNSNDLTEPRGSAHIAARSTDGAYLAGSLNGGARISTNGGIDWTRTAAEPRMACVAERSGAFFSCSANWDPKNQLDPSVVFALGRSGDGNHWTKVMRFVDIAGPLNCPENTIQHRVCEQAWWPCQAEDFGISWPVPCPLRSSPDAGTGSGDPSRRSGCCRVHGGGDLGLGLIVLVALALAGRPRQSRRRPRRNLTGPRFRA